jgi:plastocyanin
MRWSRYSAFLWVAALASALALAQDGSLPPAPAGLRMRLNFQGQDRSQPVSAVVWLEAVAGTPTPSFPAHGRYTLRQKNRTFLPHLLVVPVGSVVLFPNADPFFHNVFSLFDGRRFDLGLYEAGSSKEVSFPREGVSYIFCNIHPEMGAVVVALSTPLYAIADRDGRLAWHHVAPGSYKLRVWVEGLTQPVLDQLSRRVQVGPETSDLGEMTISVAPHTVLNHPNMFGRDYDQEPKPAY